MTERELEISTALSLPVSTDTVPDGRPTPPTPLARHERPRKSSGCCARWCRNHAVGALPPFKTARRTPMNFPNVVRNALRLGETLTHVRERLLSESDDAWACLRGEIPELLEAFGALLLSAEEFAVVEGAPDLQVTDPDSLWDENAEVGLAHLRELALVVTHRIRRPVFAKFSAWLFGVLIGETCAAWEGHYDSDALFLASEDLSEELAEVLLALAIEDRANR